MKILSIRIKNLASLAGEHFIDFESEPLASAGLVAIVGKTGAGKSTILDAMCLALFNRVPRLKDSDGKLIDVDGSELLTNSPQTVLRRGTGHGFAELSFIAQDQKVYLARWEIKRARENPNGKLQSVQRSLKCLTDGVVVADKTKAVEIQILRITQLSFEQFTRAVLLAQSEVTAFLKARDNERGELLEYLTNSSIFAKIGQLAFEKTKEIASQRKEIENILGHIEILSDEDFTTINTQFESFNVELKKLEDEKFNLQQQQQWFEQKQKYETEVQTHQQQLNLQQQQLDALAPEKAQLHQLERFSPIRPYVIQHQNFIADLEKLQPLLEKSQQEFNVVEQQFNAEKIAFEKIEDEQKQQNQFEIQHREKIKIVRERIAEREFLIQQLRKAQSEFKEIENQLNPHLNHEKQIQEQLDRLNNDIAEHTAKLENSHHFSSLDDALTAHIDQVQRFIKSYEQFEKNYGDVNHANSKITEQKNELEQLTKQFGQSDALSQKIVTLRDDRDQLLQKLTQLDMLQHQWQNFQRVDIEHHKLANDQNMLNQQFTQTQTEFNVAEKQYLEQKNSREQLQKALQQQRLLNTENIEKLRAELVDGEACLVCGSAHHPYTNKEAFSNELLKLQEQQEQQALDSEKAAFDVWQKLQNTLATYSASLSANSTQLKNLSTQHQQLQSELEAKLKSLNIKFDFSCEKKELTMLLQHQKDDMQQTQKQLDDALISHEKALKLNQTLSLSISQTSQHLSSLQQAEFNIQHILNLLNDSEKELWKQSTLSTAEHILNLLQQRHQTLKQLNDVTTQLNQANQQLGQCQQQIKFSQEKIQSAEKTIKDKTLDGKRNSEIAIQAILEMTQQSVDKPHEWLAEFEIRSLQLKEKVDLARQRFDQVHQSFDNVQSTLHKWLNENTQLKKQAEQANANIQQWLDQNSEFNHAILQQLSAISHEQEQQLKQRITEVKHAYTVAKERLSFVENQLKIHLKDQPTSEFDVLVSTMNSLTNNMRALAEQRDELKLKLEVHQRNIAKQNEFFDQIKQIQVEEHRWNKISSLMGDSTGKKFRDYAQQYNLDILIEYANQQLAMLSQRYTLKRLDNSLSLAIVDHDMDGETRSVSSLSGGESFLTALALSLAIASMASGSMKIESLFIDEGFGTLDASSLHMVMNALDQLQSQGRKVVLISHIQDMHERIPVQIQVQPVGAGASRIEVVG